MARGDDVSAERIFSDRDDEGEDLGGFSGGIPYDEDEDEDGGWAINKDHSDSLWDSAEESDEDDEEPAELADAGDTEEEEPDVFGGGLTAPRRRGRKPASAPTGTAVPVVAPAIGGDVGPKGKSSAKPPEKVSAGKVKAPKKPAQKKKAVPAKKPAAATRGKSPKAKKVRTTLAPPKRRGTSTRKTKGTAKKARAKK